MVGFLPAGLYQPTGTATAMMSVAAAQQPTAYSPAESTVFRAAAPAEKGKIAMYSKVR